MAYGAAAAGLDGLARDRHAADLRRLSYPARFLLPLRHSGPGDTRPGGAAQHLVVTGLYRYVRNPMYVAVSSLVFGQGLLVGSVQVLKYGVLFLSGSICLSCFMKSRCCGKVRRRI